MLGTHSLLQILKCAGNHLWKEDTLSIHHCNLWSACGCLAYLLGIQLKQRQTSLDLWDLVISLGCIVWEIFLLRIFEMLWFKNWWVFLFCVVFPSGSTAWGSIEFTSSMSWVLRTKLPQNQAWGFNGREIHFVLQKTQGMTTCTASLSWKQWEDRTIICLPCSYSSLDMHL